MKRMCRWGVMVCFVQTLFGGLALGQEASLRYSDLPADSIMLISIDVASLKAKPELELLPWELISVSSQEQLGVDALLIESVDVTVGMPSPSGPEFGASIRTGKQVDIADLIMPDLGDVQTSPRRADLRFRQFSNQPMRIAQSEPNRILAGSDATLRRMLANKSSGSKALEVLQESKAPIRIVMAVEPVRDLAIGFLEDNLAQLPPPVIDPLIAMLEKTTVIRLTATAGLSSKISLDLIAESAEAARELERHLVQLRDIAVSITEAQMKASLEQDPNTSEALKKAFQAYTQRAKKSMSLSPWKVQNDRLSLEIDSNGTAALGVSIGLLLPAVQAGRAAAQRTSTANNQKQIMLALLNYESAYKRFPNRVWKKQQTKALLSWRVAILPFLEQSDLYQEFHLDEPWDSPHNIKLLDRMPATFKNPRIPTQPGYTTYLLPYGSGLLGSDEGPLVFGKITDGTSNTISTVEVSAQHAVPWTCPEDINVDELDLRTAFPPKGSNISFWDGSVQMILPNVDKSALKAFLTPSAGDFVNR